MQLFHALRKLLCESPNFFLRWPTNDGHIDMYPAGASRLGEIWHLDRIKSLMHQQRRFTNLGKRGALYRVQVEVQIVGTIYIVAARVPRIQINTAEVHEPKQRREI